MEEEAAALKERLKEQATPKPKPKPKSRARAPVVQKLQELDRDSLATKFSLTGDQMACYLGFWEQANREGAELDRGNIEQMFLDAGITEAVMADVLQGLGMSMALDMDNDPNRFILACKLLSLIQNNIEISGEAATAHAPLPMIDTDNVEDAQRPWLVGNDASEEDIKGAVLCGPSGSFLIQKKDDKSFVLTINADGEAISIPIVFGLRAGKKCYMLGDTAHATLESLVASLTDPAVLEEITGKQIKVPPIVATRPKKAAAADVDVDDEEESYLDEANADSGDGGGGSDSDAYGGSEDEEGEGKVRMRKDKSKKARPKTRVELIEEEIESAKLRILGAFKEHNTHKQDYMNSKLEEEVLGNRKVKKKKRVKHDTKELKKILARVDKETASAYASGTACKAVKPKSRVYLAIKPGELLELVKEDPLP